MSYTKAHKFVLRSIASRGAVTALEAQNVLRSYAEDTELSIPDLIRDINEEIRPFQQTIKTVTDEFTNEEVHVFLSLGFDEATKAQNFFTANELEFFRLLIEEIMSTETRQVTGIHAINLVGKMKGSFTKTDAQKLLKTWCNMHYLAKDDGKYALGVRAIHEFESYLREHMPYAIEECCLCKQIVFRGYNCPACSIAVHSRCLNKYLEKIQKWPCCKYDYDANQLELLQAGLSPTQRISMQSETYPILQTINESAPEEILTEDIDLTQHTDPGVSQCVSRKRKRRQME